MFRFDCVARKNFTRAPRRAPNILAINIKSLTSLLLVKESLKLLVNVSVIDVEEDEIINSIFWILESYIDIAPSLVSPNCHFYMFFLFLLNSHDK